MVSIAEADKVKKLVSSKFKGKTVFKIGKYKDGYLVLASETNNSFNDPYYFVKGGSVTQFLPMEDFAGFNQAFGKGLIYDNHQA